MKDKKAKAATPGRQRPVMINLMYAIGAGVVLLLGLAYIFPSEADKIIPAATVLLAGIALCMRHLSQPDPDPPAEPTVSIPQSSFDNLVNRIGDVREITGPMKAMPR